MPASRSRIRPNTLGESKRGRQSHSTLPPGAKRQQVSQSERKAYSPIGGKALRPKLSFSSPSQPRSRLLVTDQLERPGYGLHQAGRSARVRRAVERPRHRLGLVLAGHEEQD